MLDDAGIEMSFTGRSGASGDGDGTAMADEPEMDMADNNNNDISAITENKDDKLTQS